MWEALSVGVVVGGVTTTIQTLISMAVIRIARWLIRHGWLAGWLGQFALLQLAAALLTVSFFLQMAVWAAVFVAVGEFPGAEDAFYHSATNFTTLGYGDVIMSRRWRLLGPIEAANGVLTGGVSAALMFAVMGWLREVRGGTNPGL